MLYNRSTRGDKKKRNNQISFFSFLLFVFFVFFFFLTKNVVGCTGMVAHTHIYTYEARVARSSLSKITGCTASVAVAS